MRCKSLIADGGFNHILTGKAADASDRYKQMETEL